MARKAAKKDASQDLPADLEQALAELEQLIEHMEQGDITLEESLQCFERGIRLTRHCQETLKAAEQKVKILLERDGEAVTETFDAENGG